MPITALPTPPSRQDPDTFEVKADAFLGALPQFGEEANDLADSLNGAEAGALTSANAASVSAQNALTYSLNSLANAQNAAASNSAPKWVSGTTYTAGQIAWSPANGRIYKRLIAGAGTTDPSLDTTNWVLLSVVVEQTDVGTLPNQVPLNQYLGDLAFQNKNSFVIQPAASATPQQLGSVVFQLTNDTTLVIKVKGLDGTVRSYSMTLA